MNNRVSRILGWILIAAAGVGFLTVADEFRHTGEFFAVLGILLSGISFLLAGLYPVTAAVLDLRWVPAGIAVGAFWGAAVDRVVIGVFLGLLGGVLLARLRRVRRG